MLFGELEIQTLRVCQYLKSFFYFCLCLNDYETSMITNQWWHFLVPFINGVVELLNLVPYAEVVFIGDFMEGCSNRGVSTWKVSFISVCV